jgi:hypothetical protein
MLGRLRMSTEEAIAAYAEMAGYVFKEKKMRRKDGLFKATRLEESIKSVLLAEKAITARFGRQHGQLRRPPHFLSRPKSAPKIWKNAMLMLLSAATIRCGS